MNLPKLSVDNPVLINMIMVIIYLLGIYTVFNIPKESMPQVETGRFIITVTYPGVSPDEIEKLIVNEIEDELADISVIDYITSTSYEGRGVITVNLIAGADSDKAWNDIARELEKVKDLPEDASDPYMQNMSFKDMKDVCTVAVEGKGYTPHGLKSVAEELKNDLSRIEYVSRVEMKGAKLREIRVEPDKNKMEYFNISFTDIENTIKTRNLNLPGGSIKTDKSEVLIRTKGEFEEVDQIGYAVIRTFENGSALRIRDVAEIIDTYQDINMITRLDCSESVNLYLYQNTDGNILDIIDNIKEYIATVPEKYNGINARIVNDGSIDVRNNIKTLSSSAVFGIVLVFFTLLIFIGWRNAIFAAMGIPFSFLMTFWLMKYFDITINNLSLFALVLVLGMVVDDAIVIIENVHRHIEEGMSPKEAAVIGTKEVLWPVTSAVLTTVAAFMPLLMMEGNMGKFLSVFPKVVSLALFASLFEAILILPSHLADYSKPDKKKADTHFYKNLVNFYTKFVISFLKKRAFVIVTLFFIFIISFIAVLSGYVKFEFFPATTPTTLTIQAETFAGTNLERTDSLSAVIEKAVLALPYQENLQSLNTNVGQQSDGPFWDEATNLIEIRIDLADADSLTVDINTISADIRQFLNEQQDIVNYKITTGESGPPTGEDVELRILGDDMDKTREKAEEIKQILAKIDGVDDIDDDIDSGKKELEIYPYFEKLARYGVSVSEFANIVRIASTGKVVSEFNEKSDKYDIRLRLPEKSFSTIDHIENYRFKTGAGQIVILKDIAQFKITNTISRISHKDGKRTVTITASTCEYEYNGKKVMRSPSEVNEILFGSKVKDTPGILENFENENPGFKIEVGGESDEMNKSFNSLYAAFAIALIMIFMILGTQFRSYIKPFIVMVAIPFGFIGVIFGLIITNTPFSLLSMIAVVALAGIVVNDSIVFVDFIDNERNRGTDRWNSLINAGKTRLRPIILTTVTTIFGLVPMIISQSESVKMWKPMAVSIVFGLGFATLLTLFILPVIYSLIDGISYKMSGKKGITLAEALEIRAEKGYDK